MLPLSPPRVPALQVCTTRPGYGKLLKEQSDSETYLPHALLMQGDLSSGFSLGQQTTLHVIPSCGIGQ